MHQPNYLRNQMGDDSVHLDTLMKTRDVTMNLDEFGRCCKQHYTTILPCMPENLVPMGLRQHCPFTVAAQGTWHSSHIPLLSTLHLQQNPNASAALWLPTCNQNQLQLPQVRLTHFTCQCSSTLALTTATEDLPKGHVKGNREIKVKEPRLVSAGVAITSTITLCGS